MPNLKQKLIRTLRWMEQYTKTDMLYIFRGGVWTSFGFASGSMVALILTIAFANLLPKDIFGTYKYILSFSGMIGFLTLTGMNVAVSQMVARGHDDILPYAVRVQLRFNILFTIGSFGFVVYYWSNGNTTLALALLVLGITFPLLSALNTYGAYLNGKQRFRAVTAYSVIVNAVYATTMIAALLLTHDIVLLVLAYSLGNLIPTALIYWRVAKRLPRTIGAEDRRSLLKYSGHLSILNVLSTINAYIDNILVFHFAGASQLAMYGLADAVPSRLKGYMKSLVGISSPKLAQKNLVSIRHGFWLRIAQTMGLGCVAAAIYYMLAPTMFHLVFPKYLESIGYSRLIMLNFIFLPAISYIAMIMQSQRMVKEIYISGLSANILRLALYILLASIWGVLGVVWALILSNAYSLLVGILLIQTSRSLVGVAE